MSINKIMNNITLQEDNNDRYHKRTNKQVH